MTLSELVAQAYSIGYAHHGDIDLAPQEFETRLISIIEKRLGSYEPVSNQLSLAATLRTTDLYLTIGCAQGGLP